MIQTGASGFLRPTKHSTPAGVYAFYPYMNEPPQKCISHSKEGQILIILQDHLCQGLP